MAPTIASAHSSPTGCDAERTVVVIVPDKVNVVNGDSVTYTVSIGNPGPGTGTTCDAGNVIGGDGVSDGVDVFFKCPRPNGTAPGPGHSLAGIPASVTLGTAIPLRADGTDNKTFPRSNADCTGLGTSIFGTDACCTGVMTGTCPSTKCTINVNAGVTTVFATVRMSGQFHMGTPDGMFYKQTQPPVGVLTCDVQVDKQVWTDTDTANLDCQSPSR